MREKIYRILEEDERVFSGDEYKDLDESNDKWLILDYVGESEYIYPNQYLSLTFRREIKKKKIG
jgi:hypothetical protein